MSAIKYWLWLSAAAVSPKAKAALIDKYSDAEKAFYAPAGEFETLTGVSKKEAETLEKRDISCADRILAACARQGIRAVTMQDADYPQRLKNIFAPPVVIYLKGRLHSLDDEAAIAVIGTRKASAYGLKMGRKLAYEIVRSGGVVVSLLTSGVDAAAARGALLAGGRCVGVLGTAIDVNYPAANSLLIDDVASAGAVISEFPPLYPTKPENFPRRNRIISGLSCGACIVEAPVRSGALITANLALEQGRDVFAVPGNIDSPNSTGTNALIRDGAKAITGAQDILSEYEGLYPGRIQYDTELYSPPKRAEKVSVSAKTEIDKPQTIPYSDLESRLTEYTEDHRALLRCISRGETHVDEMAASTGFSAAKVLACMTVLTIRGAVKPLPGKRYSLNLK